MKSQVLDKGFIEVVDSLGNVVGAVPMVSPGPMQPLFNTYNIPVNLNFKAQFLTNA